MGVGAGGPDRGSPGGIIGSLPTVADQHSDVDEEDGRTSVGATGSHGDALEDEDDEDDEDDDGGHGVDMDRDHEGAGEDDGDGDDDPNEELLGSNQH